MWNALPGGRVIYENIDGGQFAIKSKSFHHGEVTIRSLPISKCSQWNMMTDLSTQRILKIGECGGNEILDRELKSIIGAVRTKTLDF